MLTHFLEVSRAQTQALPSLRQALHFMLTQLFCVALRDGLARLGIWQRKVKGEVETAQQRWVQVLR